MKFAQRNLPAQFGLHFILNPRAITIHIQQHGSNHDQHYACRNRDSNNNSRFPHRSPYEILSTRNKDTKKASIGAAAHLVVIAESIERLFCLGDKEWDSFGVKRVCAL